MKLRQETMDLQPASSSASMTQPPPIDAAAMLKTLMEATAARGNQRPAEAGAVSRPVTPAVTPPDTPPVSAQPTPKHSHAPSDDEDASPPPKRARVEDGLAGLAGLLACYASEQAQAPKVAPPVVATWPEPTASPLPAVVPRGLRLAAGETCGARYDWHGDDRSGALCVVSYVDAEAEARCRAAGAVPGACIRDIDGVMLRGYCFPAVQAALKTTHHLPRTLGFLAPGEVHAVVPVTPGGYVQVARHHQAGATWVRRSDTYNPRVRLPKSLLPRRRTGAGGLEAIASAALGDLCHAV